VYWRIEFSFLKREREKRTSIKEENKILKEDLSVKG
jgi:plasmid replication initiation protein